MQKKTSLFLWNLGHLKCSEKCSWNFFMKIMPLKFHIPQKSKALVWKQVCWVQNGKCASLGILTLYMLLVKYYGYGECKNWPYKRVTKNMSFGQFYVQKVIFLKFLKVSFGAVIKKQTLLQKQVLWRIKGFWKFLGGPASVVEKDSSTDFYREASKSFRSSYFFKKLVDRCFLKFKQLFSRTALDGWLGKGRVMRNWSKVIAMSYKY